jgi:hypothetical protein
MKEMFDSTILENLFGKLILLWMFLSIDKLKTICKNLVSLNREVAKKCSLYMPSIKPSQNSANYSILIK